MYLFVSAPENYRLVGIFYFLDLFLLMDLCSYLGQGEYNNSQLTYLQYKLLLDEVK